jgi:hypothetical protein
MYNLTNLTSAADIGGVAMFANNAAGGLLFGMLILAIFFIMLLSLKKWEFDASLAVSSWTCFLLGAVLSYGHFLNIIFPLAFLAIAGFTTLYLYAAGRL